MICHSNCSNLRKTEFEPADDTVLTKIETSGLSTELIWDELANFGFFKEANDESQVPRIHRPFQSSTTLPDINSIGYTPLKDEPVFLDKLYFFPKLFYNFIDEKTKEIYPVMLFLRVTPQVIKGFSIGDKPGPAVPAYSVVLFLLNKELNENIQLVKISFRGQTAQTEGKTVLYTVRILFFST